MTPEYEKWLRDESSGPGRRFNENHVRDLLAYCDELAAEVKRLRLDLVFAEGKTLVAHAAARLPVLAAVAQEREACAKLVESFLTVQPEGLDRPTRNCCALWIRDIAAAVRARGGLESTK